MPCFCGKLKRIKFRGLTCELCNSFVWASTKNTDSLKDEAVNGFIEQRNHDLRFIQYPKRVKFVAEDAIRHFKWLERHFGDVT